MEYSIFYEWIIITWISNRFWGKYRCCFRFQIYHSILLYLMSYSFNVVVYMYSAIQNIVAQISDRKIKDICHMRRQVSFPYEFFVASWQPSAFSELMMMDIDEYLDWRQRIVSFFWLHECIALVWLQYGILDEIQLSLRCEKRWRKMES